MMLYDGRWLRKLLGVLGQGASVTMNELYKAGFSQIDITPDFQVELIGCYREDNRSQGVLHPLYAQTLLFQYMDNTFCLITIDSLGLTTQLSDDLRTRVANC
jgi:hypothetical protein